MSQITRATLAGIPVMARSPKAWDLRDGVEPVRMLVELNAADAESLMEAQDGFSDPQNPGDGIEYTWEVAGGPTLTVEKLYPIALHASDIPHTLAVEVVDVRYWWSYVHVARAYNVRRRIGQQRLTQDGGPLEVQPLADVIAFWPWTLKNFASGAPVAWDAKSVLVDVLDVVTGSPNRYRIEANLKRDVPIEGTQINDNGQDAVRRVLSFMSGAALFVDYDGTAWVRDARDGREELVLNALQAMVDGPIPVRVSHRLTRPRKIRCLVKRRVELRVDSLPEVATSQQGAQDASTTSAISNPTDVNLRVFNVAPVPDSPSVRLADGRIVVTGNWVRLTDLFAGWAADRQAGQLFDISADLIRETWLAPGLLQALVQGLAVDPSLVLARRLATARGHMRATWQLDPKLVDRLESIEAARVAILDYQTGVRAPSKAYMDWTAIYNLRGPNRPGQDSFRLMDVFAGYPGSQTTPLATGSPAPFGVSVLDADQGVFHVEPLMDPTGAVVSYVPGRVAGPNNGDVPKADPREGQPGKTHTILKETAQLSTGFAVAIVFTVVAGAPNDEAKFHVQEVSPADVEKIVGRALGPCDGPAMDIFIGPDLICANVAWQDDPGVVAKIKGSLGLPPFGDPKGLIPANEADVVRVCRAAAAQVYMAEVDRIEGGITGAINPTVRPIGSAGKVSHGLAPNGEATTTVTFPAEPPGVDLAAFLDERHRRRLLGLVDKKSVVQ